MALAFSTQAQEKIRRIVSSYPEKMAACLPLLHLAQEEFGYVSEESMDLVAGLLELPPSHVYGVATFYTMYNKKPVGKFHIQVCTNVSCMVCGAYDLLGRFERALGIQKGGTTSDGLFTLNEVECLAYCGTAPAVQINDHIRELLTPDDVEPLIAELRAGNDRIAGATQAS